MGFAGKPDSLRTTRSLDGQNMLRQGVSSERSAESVLVRQRSPYLAPVRNLRTAGGDSGFGTQRRDRLAQFAAYLEGQKEERADDEMATLGEEDGKRAGSPATSGDRLRTVSDSHLEKQAPSLSEEGSQRRYERGWIQAGSPGRSPTKRPLESGCAAAKPQRWVIGESRPNRQRASALPELKSKRSNGTRVSGGAGSPTPGNGVPAEETSWSKTDKQRRRRRLSKEQVRALKRRLSSTIGSFVRLVALAPDVASNAGLKD